MNREPPHRTTHATSPKRAGNPASPVKRALLLVAHGAEAKEAAAALAAVAARIRFLRPELFTTTAYLSVVGPRIGEGLAACVAAGAREVVVHPYFLVPGKHAVKDVPRQVREAARAWPEIEVRVTPPLGADDRLADLVLERSDL